MMPKHPIPKSHQLPRIRDTLLTALDIFREECGHHPELDEARQFVLAMERIWPSLESVPDGVDSKNEVSVNEPNRV